LKKGKNMKNTKDIYNTIDEYIALFPEDIRKKLIKIRETVKAAAPEATEKISYQIPAFALKGNLVYFAAFKNHIGFYPTSSGTSKFQNELSSYDVSKGTIRFPLDRPIPYDLIRKIVLFRVKENLKKTEAKSKKR
jgi:uncharacterized protein YdhG (YjbR/CyaY superfamily)